MTYGTSWMPRPCGACHKHGAATRSRRPCVPKPMPGCRHQTRLLATPVWVTPAKETRAMAVEVVTVAVGVVTVTVAVTVTAAAAVAVAVAVAVVVVVVTAAIVLLRVTHHARTPFAVTGGVGLMTRKHPQDQTPTAMHPLQPRSSTPVAAPTIASAATRVTVTMTVTNTQHTQMQIQLHDMCHLTMIACCAACIDACWTGHGIVTLFNAARSSTLVGITFAWTPTLRALHDARLL